MKLKSKLLVGASSLVMAGGMMAAMAPSAFAAPTPVGSCGGSVSLIKVTSSTKGVGLTDQTQPVKVAGALAKDQSTKTAIAGTCSGVEPLQITGQQHIPAGNHTGLTTKALASVLTGDASCANGPTAQAADATAATAWALSGKVTATMNQTYVDGVSAATKPYMIQTVVEALGFDAAGPDVLDLGGIVAVGLNPGAMLTTSASLPGSQSNIWEDPVAKTGGASGYNTGYELDLSSAANCANGTPNDVNLTTILSGGGGSSATSLLGSSANGLIWAEGQ